MTYAEIRKLRAQARAVSLAPIGETWTGLALLFAMGTCLGFIITVTVKAMLVACGWA